MKAIGWNEPQNPLKNRTSIIKSSLTIILLISIISLLSYPGLFFYLSLCGGLVLTLGVFYKIRELIAFGIMITGVSFYFNNLAISLSLFNVALLIAIFILLYASIIYLNELIKRDIIRSNHEGEVGEILEEYAKHWRRSVLKRFSTAFILGLFSFFVIRIGTFDIWGQMDNAALVGLSTVLVFSILILLYFLLIRLPNDHFAEEMSK